MSGLVKILLYFVASVALSLLVAYLCAVGVLEGIAKNSMPYVSLKDFSA